MPTGLGRVQIRAAMFLSEPQAGIGVRPELLREMFNLTEAESLIVRELADGRSPREIARDLGISWHTVRAQQRAIYDKLGVGSQAQLVKTVWSSPVAVDSR
jgi:DNA-binding CsgD family transcriptional regulator